LAREKSVTEIADSTSAAASGLPVSQDLAKADIVIVNWRSGVLLANCLASIEKYGVGSVASVVIVDNASDDLSIDAAYDSNLPITVIRNSNNVGFGAACNQGAAVGTAPFVLFLNPDAALLENSLATSLGFMLRAENEHFAVCGIQLIDDSGAIARSCARFPTPAIWCAESIGLSQLGWFSRLGVLLKDWGHDETRVVDHVIGAYFLVRRTSFTRLRGFDERFFVYLEDLDFSYRAHGVGWKTVFLAETKAYHAGGGVSRQVRDRRLFYSLRSKLLYAFKHFSGVSACIVLGVTLFVEPACRVLKSLATGSSQDLRNTIRAYRMLWSDLGSILRTARIDGEITNH
jgi:GT2 family glycosyltransferase